MAKIATVTDAELQTIMPPRTYAFWKKLIEKIDNLYDMEKAWDKGGKTAKYVLRFRRGGKTLVSLFPKETGIGLMVVYGKEERAKFEAAQSGLSNKVVDEYKNAHTYHDGKWVKFGLPDDDVWRDVSALLLVKRKPNRIQTKQERKT